MIIAKKLFWDQFDISVDRNLTEIRRLGRKHVWNSRAKKIFEKITKLFAKLLLNFY